MSACQDHEAHHWSCLVKYTCLPHLAVVGWRRGSEHRLRVTDTVATELPLRNDC
jgi:predicted Rossmann fold nucleotide-binding protein DprA/Smf involved in DNA uptake